ncbi:putative heptaprenyl diphosphate synthase component I [Treponema primitia ZAS-2]|uniref:Putative heptaprenyl diphosphate synthase component I n=1 Tax=Treponema primitia (strain ATCC BAA-887 / DSM 12427 / ZAS-2) TaxID=545694 RepID=F5YI28_TREPZ|nr:Gx transporter family protein [Treponema primitia]AEF85572.1 putative heptaprenyl diphosphate synthase component I [Treponema primitia ZAS-2]
MKIPSRTAQAGKKVTVTVLGAFCLFLSTIEYLIPKPVPFMRLGIANLPLMLALDILPFGAFLLLLGIKVIGQALITGTLFSYIFLFSLVGTGVSALSMFGLRRLLGPKQMSLAGISVLGALLSNGAQLALARVFIFGEGARYITPPFLAMGLITGLALGLFCEYFIRRSHWYAAYSDRPEPVVFVNSREIAEERKTARPDRSDASKVKKRRGYRERARESRRRIYEGLFSGRELCLVGMLMVPALVFNPNPYFRVLQFLFFWFLAWLSGKKNNPLITILIILGIVMFNLLVPYGRVLFSVGAFRITEGALLAGIQRGVTLEALIMLSRTAIRRDLQLPGAFGEMVGESFRILALIQEQGHIITRKDIIGSIDALMIAVSKAEDPTAEAGQHEEMDVQKTEFLLSDGRRVSAIPGRIILVVAVLLAWLPWFFTIVVKL